MTVLCLVEVDGEVAADASLRALTLARGYADAVGTSLAAVVFGPPPIADLATYGITDVYVITGTDGYAPQAWARALAQFLNAVDAVAAAGTDRGNEVLAHLASITGLPMAANCVDVSPRADGAVDIVRQRWAGLLLEDAVLDAPVALLTVAADAVAAVPADVPGAAAVHEIPLLPVAGDLVIRATEAPAGAGGASLATARVVVGGGRGVGSADGFAPLEELAELLGGVVGVSRVVTSEGWRPHSMQVGQTGTKITPDLYLACGISGAIQHFAGCAGAKHIIAINTDPSAPMMTRADYAVIGDLHHIIPALVAALRARHSELSCAFTRGFRRTNTHENSIIGVMAGIRFHRVKVVRAGPHPDRGFTQGLIAERDTVWESVGHYGQSALLRYTIGDSAPAATVSLPAEYFAEGICRSADSIWQLTWKERTALRWDAATLELRDKIRFNREGWGICTVPALDADGEVSRHELVTSDGTSELVRRDPESLEPIAVVHVRCEGHRVRWLNDLTWAAGLVWANVAGTAYLVGIDLETGEVADVADAHAAAERHMRHPQAIMNGIAALSAPDEFLLTGKTWRRIRHVRLVPDRNRGHLAHLLRGPAWMLES
jgi:electron transfer flavoprotein alpha subunit